MAVRVVAEAVIQAYFTTASARRTAIPCDRRPVSDLASDQHIIRSAIEQAGVVEGDRMNLHEL
jgi:hypothetical protein